MLLDGFAIDVSQHLIDLAIAKLPIEHADAQRCSAHELLQYRVIGELCHESIGIVAERFSVHDGPGIDLSVIKIVFEYGTNSLTGSQAR
ncbi:hypothetical protein JUNP479_1664 [Aeromonas jandaei]|nr:hypothetical protein JUNP479_1664 [Aeromonas jandaei]